MPHKRIILALIAAAMATSADAAYLSDIQGVVLVNNQPLSAASAEVAPGDRIKVVKGAAALVYCNGSAIQITSGQALVVLANPPEHLCPRGAGLPEQLPPHIGGVPVEYIVEGGLVVGGSVGLAIALSQNSQPASP